MPRRDVICPCVRLTLGSVARNKARGQLGEAEPVSLPTSVGVK